MPCAVLARACDRLLAWQRRRFGQWLRGGAADGVLGLCALGVRWRGAAPLHVMRACGLIGLYRGEQEETVFARRDQSAPVGEREELRETLRWTVRRGDCYPLLP